MAKGQSCSLAAKVTKGLVELELWQPTTSHMIKSSIYSSGVLCSTYWYGMLLTHKKVIQWKIAWNCLKSSSKVINFVNNGDPMYDFLLTNNYGPISHSFIDTATYGSKIAKFAYPLDLTPPARDGKCYGSNINMTLHVRFEYPICVPSFVSIHWLVCAVCLLMLKNKKMMKK